jgi:hypothetical protein
MFRVTKNQSIAALNLSVQINEDGNFDLVPLHPRELEVQLDTLVLHAPEYETLTEQNANGLYVVFQRDDNHLRVQHFN